jgi:hypothetical protein
MGTIFFGKELKREEHEFHWAAKTSLNQALAAEVIFLAQ